MVKSAFLGVLQKRNLWTGKKKTKSINVEEKNLKSKKPNNAVPVHWL